MKTNTFSPRPALMGLMSLALGTCAVMAQEPEVKPAVDIEKTDPFVKRANQIPSTPNQEATAEMLDAQARVLFARGETEEAFRLQLMAVEKAKATLDKAIQNLARYQDRPVKNGPVAKKLSTIIIPQIDLEDTTLDEAFEFLSLRCRELDVPENVGLNFVVGPMMHRIHDMDQGRRIQKLQLRNVPVGEVLRYICQATDTRFEIDEHAVNIVDNLK